MAVYDPPLESPADNRLVTWTDWDGYLKFLRGPSTRLEQRKNGDYELPTGSRQFPDFDLSVLTAYVRRSGGVSLGQAIREFRKDLAHA